VLGSRADGCSQDRQRPTLQCDRSQLHTGKKPDHNPKPCSNPASTPAGKGDPPEPVFAKGMCRACFVEYVRAIGGADGFGADPPAFARAMRRELAAQQAEEVSWV